MSEIILNEREWVEGALDRLELGKRPVETIARLARYLYADGYKRDEIASRIERFMVKCDPGINIVKWQGIIDSVSKNAGKYPLISVDGVSVTKAEVDKIKTLKGRMLQRLMFTLLCLAKYRNAINPANNSWVSCEAKDIFNLANVKVTSKRQSLMINDLWSAGMIGYSKVIDNINLNVKIMDTESEQVCYIDDFRNIGNQYMMLVGERYMRCRECGLVVKMTSNIQKYCKECGALVHRRLSLEMYHENIA